MKATILTIGILIGFFAFSNAQYFIKLQAGYNHSIFGGKDAKAWGDVGSDPGWKPGFHLGASLNINNFEPVVLETGLYLSTKGACYKGQTTSYGSGEEEIIDVIKYKCLSYLDVPLHFRYKVTEKFSVFAGPQLSLLLSAKSKSEKENRDNETNNVKDEYSTIDISFDLGIAYQFDNNFSLQLGYDHGLLDIVKSGGYSGYGYDEADYVVKNRVIKLSVGYRLNISN